LARKPLYACGTCGLNFTRSYNAKRHNKNLHDNKAYIVTFSEYMVGRMSGKYPPGNPSFYRIKNRNPSKRNIVHQYENDNNIYYNQQKYVLDSTKTNPMPNSRDNMPNARNQFDIERRIVIFHNILQSFDRARESRKKQEIEELINEIGRMLSDILPPEQVQAKVTEFKRRLDTTTDYIALHDELYNYRMRLIDQAQRGPIWSNTYTNNPN
jgi:hypothetical protein